MTVRKPSNATVVGTLTYHRTLLADSVRTEAYRAAIEATVRPGDVVLDLGCGTGILSFFACRAGARRVYAIDEMPVIELARELARDNGFADRIVFLPSSSFDVTIPEPVDVIVTETIANNGFDEEIVSAAAHAKQAWLREGGTIIPLAVEMRGAPVELPDIHAEHALWTTSPYGLDFSALYTHAMNAFDALDVEPGHLLAAGATLAHVTIGENTRSLRGSFSFPITRDGILHGIAIWFRAELTATITITNEPPKPCQSWKQSVFPIADPMTVHRGDAVTLTIHTHDGVEWRWHVQHRDADGKALGEREQTTLRAFPFTRRRGEQCAKRDRWSAR